MRGLLLIVIAFAITANGYAQLYPLEDGTTVNTCTGVVQDSGGSGSYENNENITMTICPESPDSVLSLSFGAFNLGDGDELALFTGEDTSSPIGVFSGTDIQGQTFTIDLSGSGGCVTLQFTSDESEVGDFSAEIACGYPCNPPIPEFETDEEGDTILVCVGEEIQFDASTSFSPDNHDLVNYIWEWDDETVDSTGVLQTHTYNTSGGYKVLLNVVDSTGCESTQQAEIMVLVGTTPEFTGTTEDVVACINDEVNLELVGEVEGVQWVDFPDIDSGGSLFIPDGNGVCYQSEVTLNSLVTGGVVESPSDLDFLFMNFEHSYMGDLNISLICPNGQSMLIQSQGGGNTFLGNPIDDDQDLDPGEGWDYYWSPDATNGTWTEESAGVGTLPSGTYSATQDWSLLEGCPLNGTWTLEICDELTSDNGWIFDWYLAFDPLLYPDILTFTPEFGISCDSTFWAYGGEPIDSGSENCNDIIANQSIPGDYDYVFNATDNFGCTYQDSITVSFIEPPEIAIDYEEQDLLCNQEVELTAEILNENPLVDEYNYTWGPGGLVTSDSTLVTTATGYDTTTTFFFYVTPSNAVNCASQDSVTIEVEETDPLVVDAQISSESIDCPGDPVELNSAANGGVPGYNYQWVEIVGNSTNVVNTDSAFIANPNINDLYTYIVQVSDLCDEMAFDTVNVEVNQPEPLSVGDEVLCVGSGGQLNITGGSGNFFLSSDLLEFDNPTQPNFPTNNAGVFQILVADQCSAIQPVTALIEINGCSINVPNIFSPNGDNINDVLVFEGLLDYPDGSSLIVKNRWGKEVYSTSSYQNDWSPSDLPEGTYYYILQTTLDEDIAGYITLVR